MNALNKQLGQQPQGFPEDLSYRTGEALGQLIGLASENDLGSLTPDEAFDRANIATSNPTAIAPLLGIKDPALADTIDLDFFRDQFMYNYLAAKAADDFVDAKNEADEFRKSTINRRHDSMFRNAAVTPDQAERVMFDADNGDLSALNRVREQYFFE